MKSKKGQSLPMNTIVIAAIVLLVLVVLIMIFSGSMGTWLEDLKNAKKTDCDEFANNKGVQAKWVIGNVCTGETHQVFGTFTNQVVGQICCVPNDKK